MKNGDKELDFTKDEYWGKGGRYVVNPATGKREPAPVVEEAPVPGGDPATGATASTSVPDPAAESDITKSLKEKRRA